jgi:hypothetical protein
MFVADLPPEVEAALVPRRSVRHSRRGRAGPLRRLCLGPPGGRGRRGPGLGHHRPRRRLGRPVLVCGDLNDTPEAATTSCCSGHPALRSAPAVSPTPIRAMRSACGTPATPCSHRMTSPG